jgi:sugar O-acyltransferase (sialic acid O-acetyltransferase NeuD family)
MVIIGARGHAIELLDVLVKAEGVVSLSFYDDVTPDMPRLLYGQYPVLRTSDELKQVLASDPTFALGIGGPLLRFNMAKKWEALGGRLTSIIADTACIGNYEVELGTGLNIMQGVLVSNSVKVGEGSLLNAGAALHHNVVVGEYCEVSPGARLLGHVQVGNFAQIGAGAVVLPRVRIGHHAVIGAGAVVTRDVADNTVVVGVPARLPR